MENNKNRKNDKKQIIITKDEFYKLIAKNAKFALKDVKIIWLTIENIFNEIIENEYTLDLRGFGKLYVKTMPARKMWDGIHKKYKETGESKRANFKLAYNYRTSLKENKENK